MVAGAPSWTWNSVQNADRVGILVVDDSVLIRRLVRQVLSGAGFTRIREATSGQEAFQEIRRRPPDLVITDLVMEPGDGIELARQIRSRPESPNPFVPVIMLSAALSVRCFAEARDAGVDEFIAKPFTAQALLARIHSVTARPRQFVIAPGFLGPSRRRRQAPSSSPRRGTGEAAARFLPPQPLLQMRLAGDARRYEAVVGEGMATLRAAQQSWALDGSAELEAALRNLRGAPATPEHRRALCSQLDDFAARVGLAGIGGPVTIAQLLKGLIEESTAADPSTVIDLHLDSLLLLLAEYRKGRSPALFNPLATELARLVAQQRSQAAARNRPGSGPAVRSLAPPPAG